MWIAIKAWINDRLPIGAALHWSLDEDIPGGARFAYCFGSANLVLFLLLAVTGVLQLFYYVPTTDHAYESVMYLRLQVPFGWLIHGLHFWCAQAFIVLIGLHVARVFIWGAYKNPHEMTWIMGVFLLLLAAAMTFTGPLLAWDQLGYWAAEVGTSIVGTVPWIGGFLQRFIRGGDTMGQATLSRFFVFHVAVLPGLVAVFIVAHLVAFRQFGSAGSWHEQEHSRSGKFWPDQLYRDMLVVAVISVGLIGLAAFWRAPITGLADPIGRSYAPKPAWNFLFLYQALKVFKGRWEIVGTTGIPLVLILILLLLPFYDRHLRRDPRRRPVAMGMGAALVVFITALTVLGYLSHPTTGVLPAISGVPSSGAAQAGSSSPRPTVSEPEPPVATASQAPVPGDVQKGQEVYRTHGCAACHRINGQGGDAGPDLSNEGDKNRSADWLGAQIRDPKANNPTSIMPASPSLSQEEVQSLVDYLLSLHSFAEKPAVAGGKSISGPSLPAPGKQGPPGEAAMLIGDRNLGRALFADYCSSCHGREGMGNVPNSGSAAGRVPALNPIDPNLSSPEPSAFSAAIDRIIQHGSLPRGTQPASSMPAYGDDRSLTQPQIAAVEAYILCLNGVDRAQILSPGMSPSRFFLVSAVVLGAAVAAAISLAGLSRWKDNPK
ncbi:MAG: cytochrome b N-terminal domain-containing protein [Solirubrobacterales bacterium]